MMKLTAATVFAICVILAITVSPAVAYTGRQDAAVEQILNAEKRVREFFQGGHRAFKAQQSLTDFGSICDATAVNNLRTACNAPANQTSTCSQACTQALSQASARVQHCASLFASTPFEFLAVRCNTVQGSSCARTLATLSDPEPTANCSRNAVTECPVSTCIVVNNECRDRISATTLSTMCGACVDTIIAQLTAAVVDLKGASSATNGMQQYAIAQYVSHVAQVQSSLDIVCAKSGNTFCTTVMQDYDANFAQRYTEARYQEICEQYNDKSNCYKQVESLTQNWNTQRNNAALAECKAFENRFSTPPPTAAPTTTTTAGATTTTAAGNTTTTAAGATTTTAAGATTTTAAGATTTTAAATTTTTAAPTPAPTRVPATPRPTVSPAASCDAKFAFNAQQLLREAYTAVRCERRATGYCQLIQHQESINATVRQCVGASGQTCSAACDHDLLASVNRLDCCAKNVNITENIEQFFRNCPNTVARLRQLIAAGECPVTRGTEIIPKALALPIRWSRIADDVNLRNKFRNSCVADVAANLGIDLTAIIDPALERDPTNTVNVPTSSSARRLLQATEAGSRFNFKLQAASNSITQGASALLDQLARQGISFSQTANLVALECPTCADPQALMTVRAPQPSGAATTIASILVALLAVILTL
jgi:hypothetical protein